MHDDHVREITFFDQSYRIFRVDLQNKKRKGKNGSRMVKLVSLTVCVEECSMSTGINDSCIYKVQRREDILTRIGGWLAGGGRASYRRVEITSIIRSYLLGESCDAVEGCRGRK